MTAFGCAEKAMSAVGVDEDEQLAPEIIKVGIFSSNNTTACQLAILPAYPLTKAKEFCVQLGSHSCTIIYSLAFLLAYSFN